MYPPHVRRDAVSLLDGGLSYSEVSKRLGISRYTLRTWNRQRALVDKYRDHGSCARCEPIPRWPEPHPDYAYLLGLYLGDGCISTTGDPAKQVWSLRIFCADAWPGLTEECVRAFRSLRPSHSVHVVDRAGCKEVCARWKHWPCLFPQHGAGPKHGRPIRLEDWQRKIVEKYPRDFARGLFHSDGCRVNNRVRRKVLGEWIHYEYPRYFFSNTSADIHGLLCEALDLIGVEWRLRWKKAKKDTHRDAGILSVAKRDSVALLDTFIGPKS